MPRAITYMVIAIVTKIRGIIRKSFEIELFASYRRNIKPWLGLYRPLHRNLVIRVLTALVRGGYEVWK